MTASPPKSSIPSYRLHRPTGQAVITLNGRDIYLGAHGTDASQAAYNRLIAEWLAKGRPRNANWNQDCNGGSLAVVDVMARYQPWGSARQPRDRQFGVFSRRARPQRIERMGNLLSPSHESVKFRTSGNLILHKFVTVLGQHEMLGVI